MINALRMAGVIGVIASATLVLVPAQLAAMAIGHPARQRLPRLWHRVASRALGLKITMHGAPERQRPLLIVCNHVSWKDIVVLGAVADVVYIAKAEVRSWPIFGTFAWLQRSVFVDRNARRQTGKQVAEIAGRLSAGEAVVLFAEGTTSDGNRLLPFKTALFGAAAAALRAADGGSVFIQPVAIAYTRLHGLPMGRYHRPVAAWPGDVGLLASLIGVLREGAIDVEISFAPALRYGNGGDRKQTSRTVEAAIRDMLGRRLRGR